MSSVRHVIGRVVRIVAFLCLVLLYFLIMHKAYTDVSSLSQKNPDGFWRALGTYFICNMAEGRGKECPKIE